MVPVRHGHLDLCLSALKVLVVSALPSPFPYPLAGDKEQLEEEAEPSGPAVGLRCALMSLEPPETMQIFTQLSWLGLVFCTQNELK